MKTTYLNPFNQNALQILQSYGNITQITETTQKINKVIETTHNQDKKHVNTIKELCYEKIRYYYQDQTHTNNNSYNYLFQEALEEADIISTHTLLQATAITYGAESQEADITVNMIKNMTKQRIHKTHNNDTLMDETLREYIDPENTHLTDILPLIDNEEIQLNKLLLQDDKLILTYDDFLYEYSQYLEHRRPEQIYQLLCSTVKGDLIAALIEQKTRKYMQTIEDKLKQVEPAPIIEEVGKEIHNIQVQERETAMQTKYTKGTRYTNFNDDQPTQYIPEAFPPCIKKALGGIKSGGRNYAISIFLTPFLSYARLYPGVYARHIKKARVIDMDPTLNITRGEIIPLIYEAAENCKPPLFKDQPQEKMNINSKLGFGENNISYEHSGKTPWYTPTNCQNIKMQQPELCTPCKDCQRIGNPLSYYNRKRKLLTRKNNKKVGEDAAPTSNT